MSLENSLNKLKAAMRQSTSRPKEECPKDVSCVKTVDGACMEYKTLYRRDSSGFCRENRSSVRISTSPCQTDTCN